VDQGVAEWGLPGYLDMTTHLSAGGRWKAARSRHAHGLQAVGGDGFGQLGHPTPYPGLFKEKKWFI
jgi:hypothetical protein